MPGKSRHGKGKYSVRSKRKKTGRDSMDIVAQKPLVSQTCEPVPRSEVSTSLPSTPTPSAAVSAVRYPYITTELRRIGILAGIMLVTLVVLALVLS